MKFLKCRNDLSGLIQYVCTITAIIHQQTYALSILPDLHASCFPHLTLPIGNRSMVIESHTCKYWTRNASRHKTSWSAPGSRFFSLGSRFPKHGFGKSLPPANCWTSQVGVNHKRKKSSFIAFIKQGNMSHRRRDETSLIPIWTVKEIVWEKQDPAYRRNEVWRRLNLCCQDRLCRNFRQRNSSDYLCTSNRFYRAIPVLGFSSIYTTLMLISSGPAPSQGRKLCSLVWRTKQRWVGHVRLILFFSGRSPVRCQFSVLSLFAIGVSIWLSWIGSHHLV